MTTCSAAVAALLLSSLAIAGCGSNGGSGLSNATVTSRPPQSNATHPALRRTEVLGYSSAIAESGGTPGYIQRAAPTVKLAQASPTGRKPQAIAEKKPTPNANSNSAPTNSLAASKSGKAPPSTERPVVSVETGDSLLKIANRYHVSVSALMAANNLASLTVEPGQKLTIPKR